MLNTPNMGLTAWNNLDDNFSHLELTANWQAVDAHDHSSGKGVPVPSGGLGALAVTTSKIATGAVTSDKLADNNVTSGKLADNGVTAAKILDSTITAAKFANLPHCRTLSASAFAVPNNTTTIVQFTGTRFANPSSMWAAGNPDRVVAPIAGLYLVTATIGWASGGDSGVRRLRLLHNATTEIAGDGRINNTNLLLQTTQSVWRFAANDYATLSVFQTSGGSLNLTISGTTATPELSMAWIGP